MKTSERIISHPSQLNGLTTLPFFRTSGLGPLRLGGSIENHPAVERWQKELNRYFYACGCDTSAKGLIIGLLAGSAWAGYSFFQGIWEGGAAVGVAVSISIGGAIAGKLFGLFRANGKLKRTVNEIQEQWTVEEGSGREHWVCG